MTGMGFALLLALIVAPLWSIDPAAAAPQIELEKQGTDEAALAAFQQAVAAYLLLHRRLEGEAPALVPGIDARQISAASDVLAGAIQRARPKARRGDFFTPDVSRVLTERLRAVVDAATFKRMLATITDEPIGSPAPRIYLRFPNASPLMTMPAHVLLVLPALPEELEYRFIRGDLILRDRHADLVIDYIPRVLPR